MAKLGDAPGWERAASAPPGPAKCRDCGKPLRDPKFIICFECNQKKREGGGNTQDVMLPSECIFQTFYDEKNHLKREIFIESAVKAADKFMQANISQSSIRNLFHLLKDMANRLQAEKDLDFGSARTTYFKFIRQVEYNAKRQVLHPIMKEFADKHIDVATKNREEFFGFVEYLTSILARLKTK